MAADRETNIPPVRHPMGFLAPVALMVGSDKKLERDSDGIPVPERTADGLLMHALPGGGRWVPGQRLCACGVNWEPDMDQFGCWSCGAANTAKSGNNDGR